MTRKFIKCIIHWSPLDDLSSHIVHPAANTVLYLLRRRRIHYLGRYYFNFALWRETSALSLSLSLPHWDTPSFAFSLEITFSHLRHRIRIYDTKCQGRINFMGNANARHHKFKWVWSFSKCKVAYFWDFRQHIAHSAFFLFASNIWRAWALGMPYTTIVYLYMPLWHG